MNANENHNLAGDENMNGNGKTGAKRKNGKYGFDEAVEDGVLAAGGVAALVGGAAAVATPTATAAAVLGGTTITVLTAPAWAIPLAIGGGVTALGVLGVKFCRFLYGQVHGMED